MPNPFLPIDNLAKALNPQLAPKKPQGDNVAAALANPFEQYAAPEMGTLAPDTAAFLKPRNVARSALNLAINSLEDLQGGHQVYTDPNTGEQYPITLAALELPKSKEIVKGLARKLGGKGDGVSDVSASAYALLGDGSRLRVSDHPAVYARSHAQHDLTLHEGMGMGIRDINGGYFDDPTVLKYNGKPIRTYPVEDISELDTGMLVDDILGYLKKQYELSGEEIPKRSKARK